MYVLYKIIPVGEQECLEVIQRDTHLHTLVLRWKACMEQEQKAYYYIMEESHEAIGTAGS